MKRIFFTGIALFAVLSTVNADLVIEQKIETAGQGSTVKIKIKGNKVRSDVGDQMTSIIDTNTLSGITLMHANKMAVKSDGAQIKAVQQQMAAAAESAKLVNTGKKESMGGYDCTIWTMEMMGTKSTLWVAKDYPDYAEIKKEMDAMNKASGQPAPKEEVDGMVMKSITEAAGTTTTMILVSADQTEVADAEFVIPAGYKEMTMPQ